MRKVCNNRLLQDLMSYGGSDVERWSVVGGVGMELEGGTVVVDWECGDGLREEESKYLVGHIGGR